jgi:3-methyladenine DNA glycosylase AlkD
MDFMDKDDIIKLLKSKASKRNVEGMARFGINTKNALGISVYVLRDMAKKIGKSHILAKKLWSSGIHEARLLAGFIGEAEKLTEKEIEQWVKDFDSWDICDQVCSNLFDKTDMAWNKAVEWTKREEEFVRRAGFVMMAVLSVHDKKSKDRDFKKFFPLIEKYSTDERNFVKKAVNWSLRQIGKRSFYLNKEAVKLAKDIGKIEARSAKWIAQDALRELTSEKVQKRLNK